RAARPLSTRHRCVTRFASHTSSLAPETSSCCHRRARRSTPTTTTHNEATTSPPRSARCWTRACIHDDAVASGGPPPPAPAAGDAVHASEDSVWKPALPAHAVVRGGVRDGWRAEHRRSRHDPVGVVRRGALRLWIVVVLLR